ncbi:hypothetical protein [Streptococcus sanguinis]|uniref:hypothetical protein n=1 Tax=Streptococcus sanguinis TaxID=1305 RepID=UPI001CBC9CD7|nr:hypothetical protein [Streptococcus sanguinis]MBZ2021355.1 hypothetical protein [Streptococcus sanguinis]MBZ2072419.1 hypothetical protein [Streptococcus sanguinis]MBZ2080618.1 hypothetical protein [Streptococcus sanguinis]MCC3164922.1 hypothetical protein [Streptococcus sanguinis]
MIYITKEDVLTWLDKHEPVANRQKDIAAFHKELSFRLQRMDFRPSSSSKDPQRDVCEDVAFTQDGEGNYATIDQSPGGQILSDQRFKMALKKVLNYDDDMVDRLLYGTKN